MFSLVDKSLVQQTEQADGEPRFGMLETIREYCLERLGDTGEEQATRRAHAADIAGWKEALPLMSVGSKWQLFIPSKLAYGVQGVGSKVGPIELVLSELELVAIK